jgi:prepilin-type N-terminal cleavage/methylation domain-containing protein
MKAFTLLELLIVLLVTSLLLALAFPAFFSSFKGEEAFENEVSSLLSSSFSFGSSPQFCVDFKRGRLGVGGEWIEAPYPVKSLVLPGKIVDGEGVDLYCFALSTPTVWAVSFKKSDGFWAFLALYPCGEVLFFNLSPAQEETLKDNLSKGRITQWFSYYSY